MAKKTVSSKRQDIFLKSIFSKCTLNSKNKSNLKEAAWVYVVGDKTSIRPILTKHAQTWQKSKVEKNFKEISHFEGKKGLVWILRSKVEKAKPSGHDTFSESDFSKSRDLGGAIYSQIKNHQVKQIAIEFVATSDLQELGVLVGFDLAFYNYKENKAEVPSVQISKSNGGFDKEILAKAKSLARAQNLARHLVNQTPEDLNPRSYSKFIQSYFAKRSGLKIQIWDQNKLKKEK